MHSTVQLLCRLLITLFRSEMKTGMKMVVHSVFHTALFLSIISRYLPKCECTFEIHPRHVIAIATTSINLECSSDIGDEIRWFKKGTVNDDVEIMHGYLNRYDIQDDNYKSTLSINSSMTEDRGDLYCGSTSEPLNTATLEIIVPTPTWFPRCSQYPERLTSGADVQVTCSSSINELDNTITLPNLALTLDRFIINSTPFRNATHTYIKYTRTVNRDDHGKRFSCQATLDNLQNPPSCAVTLFVDWRSNGNNNNIVPYIIVAVLSIVAIILFAIVIVFVFRFRECKLCKETVPQPQQVLDMSALQDGIGIPMTLLSDQSSDDEAVHSSKSKKRKTTQTKNKPSIDSVNQTSQGQKSEDAIMHFDDNFQKPESKETETKTKDIGLNMKYSEEKLAHVPRAVKQSKANKNQAKNITGPSVRQHPTTGHNKSLPNKGSKGSIHKVNNLGKPNPSKSAAGSKQLSSKSKGKQAADDNVVYADLNFTRIPGLNITKDEYL